MPPLKKKTYEEELKKHSKVMEKGRARADTGGDGFTIKCLGVFDIVGSVGFPEELSFFNKTFKQLFGFHDKLLPVHIENTFHAMALNETWKDFDVAKFIQTPEGKAKGQVLKQACFPGSVSDIGGGWRCHDLSDISLAWMIMSFPTTGFFKFAFSTPRIFPKKTNEPELTHEYIHPSILEQPVIIPEKTVKEDWPYVPDHEVDEEHTKMLSQE
ncbi:hypothetical protein M422DRAFT_272829 [Sphaerobolus stellatus SS14]|uniref:T6SS Phospholipase effector Tle1-like catalytic domain-containing protein n=1 Tax=Sphaerobolus stellatus (strain SS14) TaxID=990650 RepID=A0A0C9UKX7_SPHS4|nr:hypothetical protein M422DRAFT_272829 [Sphaerobolus stellatus SS14]